MTLRDLIARKSREVAALIEQRNEKASELAAIRSADEIDKDREKAAREAVLDAERRIDEARADKARYEAELAEQERIDELARETREAAPSPSEHRSPAVVQSEPRTYTPQTDPKGVQFVRDVARGFMFGDPMAQQRLARHMSEEVVERGDALERGNMQSRAVTTSNFAGLTVPQYLVDLVAPNAKAGRPFANACRKHDLPEKGMTVEISKITTGSSTAVQANQNDAVDETNMDDTALSVSVQTLAGQQTLARQVIERSTGAESIVLEDLFRSYGTKLDNTLLNQGTNGLTNAATNIAYTDASPTIGELYPKLHQGASEVEAALLDMDSADAFLVMHSRRWHWINSQLGSTWPLVAQPGVPVQSGGVNDGNAYGSGFRGRLVNGMPVVVSNNVATNLGAGTNEDEIYVVAQSEAHLWEDPSAPVFIRAEQTKAANLGVLLVVYGYFAYTFTRRAHARKISGTGLVAPTF